VRPVQLRLQLTEQAASASFASVTISGKSAAEIRDTTIAVFGENGYQVFAPAGD